MTNEQAANEISKLVNLKLPKHRFYPAVLEILRRLTGRVNS